MDLKKEAARLKEYLLKKWENEHRSQLGKTAQMSGEEIESEIRRKLSETPEQLAEKYRTPAQKHLRELVARFGIDPDSVDIRDTRGEAMGSSFIPMKRLGLGEKDVLNIPSDNDFITKHELSHATSPLEKLTMNLPSMLAGNAGTHMGLALGTANMLEAVLEKATGKDPRYLAKDLQGVSVENPLFKALRNKYVLGAGALGYAPRFMEETQANARALKDEYDQGGMESVMNALPSLAMSEGSYVLPALGMYLAHRRHSAPTDLSEKINHVGTILAAGLTGHGNLSGIPSALKRQIAQWR